MRPRSVARNLESWFIFASLARSGNITQTAIELDLHPSVISRAIVALEEELGIVLLDRKVRPFVLTADGRSLLAEVSPLISGFDDLLGSHGHNLNKKIIKVAAPSDLSRDAIPDQLMEYMELHPEIQFDLQTQRNLDSVISGSVDVLLYQFRPARQDNLVVRPCISTTSPVFCSPKYLERFGLPTCIADLKNHLGLLQRTREQIVTSVLYKDGQPSELLNWKKIFIANDQYTLKYLLLKGYGITVDLCPQFVVDELLEGTVVPILEGWERSAWELFVVTRKDREVKDSALKQFAVWWANREAEGAMKRVLNGKAALDLAKSRSK